MPTLVALAPIVLLIGLMTKKKSVPSHIALPLVAVLMYLLKIFYFGSDINLMNATVIDGLLTAWTPILVIWGAIFLFHTMENTGAMKTIREWLNGITQNKIAQLMIIGWAFAFLIEGASGFGTPAALAAPLLVGLGFKPLRVAMLALVMNSVPVSFGAVGTPIWFGLGQLGLSESQLIEIGVKSAMIHGVAALIIPLIALRFVMSTSAIKKNLVFIYLSILSCITPYILFSYLSYEFPAILGGLIGLILTIFLAKKQIGMEKESIQKESHFKFKTIAKATFALWGTVLTLLITRIEIFKLKSLLNATAHSISANLQPFAEISLSPSLVLQLENILETGTNFKHALLYVPSIIPFFLIAFISIFLFKWGEGKGKNKGKGLIQKTWSTSWQQIKKPILALLAALVFVKLLLVDGGDQALSQLIGQSLANLTGVYWQYFASFLGGVGSFFSGSNTVSNLTFGGIQQSIAGNLELNLTTILAAQNVGGAMGNMICINNIVAVCSVLGIEKMEGAIIKKTIWPMLIYGLIAGMMTLF